MDKLTKDSVLAKGRNIQPATSLDPELGDLRFLPGTWENSDRFQDRGWNMIALPFSDPDPEEQDSDGNLIRFDYRVLANQYNETLFLKTADKGVPNRGVIRETNENMDQTLIALDYEQAIIQVKGDDSPTSAKAGGAGKPIHHEPGLWLQMLDHHRPGANIARLGTVPHGNSLLALGSSESIDVSNLSQIIPEINAFPVLAGETQVPIDSPLERYLTPYQKFTTLNNGFFPPEFGLGNLHALLQASTPQNVTRGMRYSVSTTVESGGIINTPFIVDQANATELTSTFWIYELNETDQNGEPVMVMQYMQFVMLDFFDKFDNSGGKIRWPHISLNTMVRTSKDSRLGEDKIRAMMYES